MNYNMNCTCKLAELMRQASPAPGTAFKRMVIVDLEAGEKVGRHQHKQATVLYYPADASPVQVTPVEGMIIYLPPETPHHVPPATSPRLSVAMLIEPID